jgi:hypothetical protein
VSRLQPRFAPDWEILLRPGVGEGRNNVLKGSWCASLVFESVQNRFGSSRVIEAQSEGQHRRGRGTESVGWSCNSVPREKEGGAVC